MRYHITTTALVILTPSFQSEDVEIDIIDLEEIRDSPNYLWGSGGAGDEWKRISDSNGLWGILD